PTLRVAWDPESGFFGTAVKGDRFVLQVSEYDLILAVADDGSYRVMTPPEKQLFTGRLLYCDRFDPETGVAFTVVYRDRQRIPFAKRVRIERFIRNKEYELVKGKAGRIDLLLPGDADGTLWIRFAPAKRQRVTEATFDLAAPEPTGVAARGTRLAAKPVAKIELRARAPGGRRRPGGAAPEPGRRGAAGAKAPAPGARKPRGGARRRDAGGRGDQPAL